MQFPGEGRIANSSFVENVLESLKILKKGYF